MGASIVTELGMACEFDAHRMTGHAHVVPEICYPGTDVTRTAVLLTWADVLTGVPCAVRMAPRIAVTLDLDVHLFRLPHDGDIEAEARIVKAGKTVMVAEAWFRQPGDDTPFGVSHGSFMASPNPTHEAPPGFPPPLSARQRMTVPLAERAQVRHVAPGVAEVPRLPDGQNPVGSIQGGMVALSAEEAVRTLDPDAQLTSFTIRYLRPFSTGPAHAVATLEHGLAHVHIHDGGPEGKLGAVVTARVAS